MALIKEELRKNIYDGFYKIFTAQADKAISGDENEDPKEVIKHITDAMASVVSDAVDKYVKSGDIVVGPTNITVTSPAGSCVVTPASPAKIK